MASRVRITLNAQQAEAARAALAFQVAAALDDDPRAKAMTLDDLRAARAAEARLASLLVPSA